MDKYSEPKVITYDNMTVRVYSPVLTDKERARRMREIEKAVIALMR
jgi:hypothetical protein